MQFTAATYQTLERAGEVVLTVERTGNRHNELQVRFATSDETAEAGSDYTARSGNLIFPASGAATRTITIPIRNNHRREPDKTFKVKLMPSGSVRLGTQKTATVTIRDRD